MRRRQRFLRFVARSLLLYVVAAAIGLLIVALRGGL